MTQLLREIPRDRAPKINEDIELELFDLIEDEDTEEKEDDLLVGWSKCQ